MNTGIIEFESVESPIKAIKSTIYRKILHVGFNRFKSLESLIYYCKSMTYINSNCFGPVSPYIYTTYI